MTAFSRHARGSKQKRGTTNKKQAKARDKRMAKKAAAAARTAAEAMADLAEPEEEAAVCKRDAAQDKRRRHAIVMRFIDLGSPAKDTWDGPDGVVHDIRKWLGMRCNANIAPIRQVLDRHVAGELLVKPRSGRKPKLTKGEALIATHSLEAGKGRAQAAHDVTAWRELQGKDKVSEKAVRTGFKNLGGVTQRRGTEGTGSRDEESAWAQTSLAQAEQLKGQIVTPEEEERAAAEQQAEAAATGPLLKVEGRSGRVRSLADDPLHVIGRKEHISVPYSWWREWWDQQPAKVRRKKMYEKCELVGYVASYTHGDGGVEPAYIIKCSGKWGCFAMRAPDAIRLLPARLQPTDATVDEDGKVP